MTAADSLSGRQGSTSRSRFLALYETVRERICLLLYPPGTRLSEAALAAEFGVSRTPIRRVLSYLEADGLVESRHGVGTVVTTPDPTRLRQTYALRARLAELNGEMEPLAPDGALLERLRGLLAAVRALTGSPAATATDYSRLNMEFVREVNRLIGNVALREVSERLYFQTARLVLDGIRAVDLVEEAEIFTQEIADTLAALERGDLRAAGLIRRNHIAWSYSRLTGQPPAAEDGGAG